MIDITLRDHTIDVYNKICNAAKAGKKNILCLAGTGFGKTYVSGKFIQTIRPFIKKKNVLILVPDTSLINEWQLKLEITEDDTIDIYCYARIQRMSSIEYKSFIKNYGIIICDEAHTVGSPKTQKIFKYTPQDTYIIGCTATEKRYADKTCSEIDKFFDAVVKGPSTKEAISSGVLNQLEYVIGLYDQKEEIINYINNKFRNKSLADIDTLDTELDKLTSFKAVKESMNEHLPDKFKGIVFVKRQREIKDTIGLLKAIRPEASVYSVCSNQSHKKNAENIKGFKLDTNNSFIVSVNKLNEGIHIEDVNVLVMLRKTDSARIYEQQLGRGLSCDYSHTTVVFDMVNNINVLDRLNLDPEDYRMKKKFNGRVRNSVIVDEDKDTKYIVSTELIDYIDTVDKIQWSSEENEKLIKIYYKNKHYPDILKEEFPNKTLRSINAQANRLGLKFYKPWNAHEISTLKKYYGVVEENRLLVMLPGRTLENIHKIAKKIGVELKYKV